MTTIFVPVSADEKGQRHDGNSNSNSKSKSKSKSKSNKNNNNQEMAITPIISGLPPNLPEAHSDDTSTILNLSDYSPDTWGDILSYGVPTIGMAFLLITHPVFFLAGASISLLGGGVYAATVEGDCGAVFRKDDDNDGDKDNFKIIEKQETTTTTATTAATSYTEQMSQEATESKVPAVLNVEEETPQLCLTDEDSTDNHSVTAFDTPSHLANVILDTWFQGIHAKEFFEVFFGDDAPFSFRDFQKQRGDTNVNYGPWEDKKRMIRFQAPTRVPLMGPSYATAIKHQFLLARQKHRVVMESTSRFQDIPYSDRFDIRELWVLESQEKRVHLKVSAQAEFRKTCPFESQIKSKSTTALRETLEAWAKMARRALEITQRQRQKAASPSRLHQGEEIEVTYRNATKQSCVVGEDEEDDWELDPLSEEHATPQRRQRKTRGRNSLRILRESITSRFGRNHSTASSS